MRGYKHLTYHDRLKIEKMKREGKKQVEIAHALHVSESTISRELKRAVYIHTNSDLTEEIRYNPDEAQRKYEYNKTAKGQDLKISNDHALAEFLEKKIVQENYSPCAALAEIKNNPKINFKVSICRATLYKYIDREILNIKNKNLPFKGKRKKKQRKLKSITRVSAGCSIEKRPKKIEKREEFGHWEIDTVLSCNPSKSGLFVMTERKTRQEIIFLISNHKSETIRKCLNFLEKKLGKFFHKIFKTLTMDNGVEFSDCSGMENSINNISKRTKCYYCHPYCSSERGSCEKQNQMLRRHFPKGTEFSNIPLHSLKNAVNWLNNYPRKLLNWQSSQDLFNQEISKLTSNESIKNFFKKNLAFTC